MPPVPFKKPTAGSEQTSPQALTTDYKCPSSNRREFNNNET
jgi:hypothetical protein